MTASDPALEQPALVSRRLDWIEGLRGIAALVVALGHIVKLDHGLFGPTWEASGWAGRVLWPLNFNGQMVPLFLMISGFSLVYAEDKRRASGRSPTSLGRYFRRRAWRLGPVYYLALAVGLAVTLAVSASALHATGEANRPTAGGTVTHLLLLHNATPDWQIEGNAPLWSLAYEAQLYLLLPLLMVVVRGWRGTVITAVTCTVLVLLLPSGVPYRLDLIIYFVVGCWLARIYPSWPKRLVVPTFVAFWALLLVALLLNPSSSRSFVLLWTAVFAALLLSMAYGRGARAAGSRPLRGLGARSYSLYAMHVPVVILVAVLARSLGLTGLPLVGVVLVVAGLITVAVVEVTWRQVERWSLERVRRT